MCYIDSIISKLDMERRFVNVPFYTGRTAYETRNDGVLMAITENDNTDEIAYADGYKAGLEKAIQIIKEEI